MRLTTSLGLIMAFFASVASQNTTRVTTYNIAGSPMFSNKSRRVDATIRALKTLDSDIYCLQEVWFELDLRKIVNEMRRTHPYSHSVLHYDTQTVSNRLAKPPCYSAKFVDFLICMLGTCSNTTNRVDRVQCATHRCPLLSLSQECITCLSTIDDSLLCGQTGGVRVNDPGLLVVSKRPLINPAFSYFDPDMKHLVPQAVLAAEVDQLGFFLCTHLAADLGEVYLEYGLQSFYKTYQEQNMVEADQIINATVGIDPIVIAGSINAGPRIPENNVSAEFAENYGIFLNGNFSSPYVDSLGLCTHCSENYHVPGNASFAIDHVFIRGLNATSVKRVFTEPMAGSEVHMSDHYGVEVTLG